MKFSKVIFSFILIIFSTSSFSLIKEVTIKRSNSSLPLTQVRISDGYAKWSMFNSSGADSVLLSDLGKSHALSLLKIS